MIIYEKILREFQKQDVQYIIVGGIAVNLLGSLRSTADIDIIVEMSNSNLAKIVKILTKYGYRVKQPVDPMGIADTHIRNEWINNKHMKAFNFYKDKGLKEVDIIIESPVSFNKAIQTVQWIKCDDLYLPVISISNLIKMKKVTGRNVDSLDIDQLNRLKRLRKKKK